MKIIVPNEPFLAFWLGGTYKLRKIFSDTHNIFRRVVKYRADGKTVQYALRRRQQ